LGSRFQNVDNNGRGKELIRALQWVHDRVEGTLSLVIMYLWQNHWTQSWEFSRSAELLTGNTAGN
jgi:hypothetical protein